jgi:hypothetical protein
LIVATTWPDALVASVTIVAVAAVLIALISQIFAAGRSAARGNGD